MKNKLIAVIILLLVVLRFTAFSSSFIIKFKTIEDKSNFLKIYSKTPSIEPYELPFQNSVENYLHKNRNDIPQSSRSALENLRTYLVVELKDEMQEEVLYNYLNKAEVEYIEPNFKVSVEGLKFKDELAKEQWYFDAINVQNAWKTSTGKGVRVGIIDTGIDLLNKELSHQIWINPSEDINHNGTFEPWPDTVFINGVSGDLNNIDDDGNGFVDDLIGYDFVSQLVGNFGDYSEPDPIPEDEHGHGTLVAGVIAAGINDTGIVGVAPEAKIVVLRSFDVTGNAEVKDIASAVVYAGLNRVDVLNLSFGTHFDSRLLREAIRFAASMGCVIVASAGNDGEIIPHYPSDYPEVISVGATTKNGTIGKSSNYGPRVDIFAPGYEILSTSLNNTYKYVNGTSFSSPIVSGVVALMLQKQRSLTTAELRSILKATQIPLTKDKKSFSQGIVDAGSAVSFIGSSIAEICQPSENQEVDISKVKKIDIVYSVYSPMFESYTLELLKNDTTFVSSLIEHQTTQRLKDTFSLDIGNLDIGSYSIRLRMYLKNGNTYINTRKFLIFSSNIPLSLLKNRVVNSIYETKVIPVYISETNMLSFCNVFAYEGSMLLEKFSDNLYSKEHFVNLYGKNVNFNNSNLKIIVEHRTSAGWKILDTLLLDERIIQMQKPAIKKYNLLPLSYIYPNIVKLKQFNGNGILINPYNNLEWNNLVYYKFKDSLFSPISEYSKPFIPVAIGNSNGNEFDEIMTTSYGKTIIFEPLEEDKMFNNIIFQSQPNETLWASGFFDFDRDGKDELICFNNDSIVIYKYSQGKYQIAWGIKPDDTLGNIGTKPNIQVADFDKDGFYELSFFTTNGYLLIYQFNPNTMNFTFEFRAKLSNIDPFSVASCIGKFGDSNVCKLYFIAGVNLLSDEFQFEYSTLWKLSSLRCVKADEYQVREELSFWGSRIGATPQGIFYRNGIVCGNVDNDEYDEIFVSLFPNFYVFKYEEKVDNYLQIQWLPYVYSNSVIIGDFDQNGKVEFGISRWNGLSFYEFLDDNVLSSPQNCDGWIDLNDTIYLRWDEVTNANLYQVFELNTSNNSLVSLGFSSSNIFAMTRNSYFGKRIFVLRALDTTGKFLPSEYSNEIVVFDTIRTKPVSVYYISPDKIIVSYEGRIAYDILPKNAIYLSNDIGYSFDIQAINILNDTSFLITTTEPLEPGKYFVELYKFRDYWGNYTEPSVLTFQVFDYVYSDTTLIFEEYNFIGNNTLEVQFAEPLDFASAVDLSNYRIIPFGSIQGVNLSDERTVSIQIAASPNIISLGKDFYLVLGRIYSKDFKKFVHPPFNTIYLTRETQEIDNAFAYPNPINLNYSSELTFANVPESTKIEIFDSHFRKILEIENMSKLGGVQLDLLNYSDKFYPGVYYFRILKENEGKWINSGLKKFAIVR
jgi:subtilisin family serine protease